MLWLMLQQDELEDFVIANGMQHTVRNFVDAATAEFGLVLRCEGEGVTEVGVVDESTLGVSKTGRMTALARRCSCLGGSPLFSLR